MGKAGPNMLVESKLLGKPFIATSYIPAGTTQSPILSAHNLAGLPRPVQPVELVRSRIHNPKMTEMKTSGAEYNTLSRHA